MKSTVATLIALVSAVLTIPIMAEESGIREVEDIKSLGLELPQALQVRMQMAEMQDPEHQESNKQFGFKGDGVSDYRTDPGWAKVYQAWDGMVFIADDLQMALWVKEDTGWKCVVPNVRVHKTFGGAFPRMPVKYLGKGLFAVSETLSVEVEEESKNGFPQAMAVTFLIDSKEGKVKERSKSFVYDHNPPVVVPEEWKTRYDLKKPEAAREAK